MSGYKPGEVTRSGEGEAGADKRLLWFENSGHGLVVGIEEEGVWIPPYEFIIRHNRKGGECADCEL